MTKETPHQRITALAEGMLEEGADPDAVLDALMESAVSLAILLDRQEYMQTRGAKLYEAAAITQARHRVLTEIKTEGSA